MTERERMAKELQEIFRLTTDRNGWLTLADHVLTLIESARAEERVKCSHQIHKLLEEYTEEQICWHINELAEKWRQSTITHEEKR